MHSVDESATNEERPGVRERKRSETEAALIHAARELTTSSGLAGFTIEQLCERVGVSRRTFFNYFAAKEDAVLGFSLHKSDEDAVAAFLAGGDPEAKSISATLFDDLATLSVARWQTREHSPEDLQQLIAAIDSEPRLFPRLLELGAEMERTDAALIATREGLDPTDRRVALAAQLIGMLSHRTMHELLTAERADSIPVDYAHALRTNLESVRELFSHTTRRNPA